MYDVSYLTICGRVSKDPERRKAEDGTLRVTFDVAVNPNKEKANFYSVTAYGALGDYALKQLKTSSRVTVLGKFAQNTYSQTGQVYNNITADQIFPGTYIKPQGAEGDEEIPLDEEGPYV